jgi:hypothetical protein
MLCVQAGATRPNRAAISSAIEAAIASSISSVSEGGSIVAGSHSSSSAYSTRARSASRARRAIAKSSTRICHFLPEIALPLICSVCTGAFAGRGRAPRRPAGDDQRVVRRGSSPSVRTRRRADQRALDENRCASRSKSHSSARSQPASRGCPARAPMFASTSMHLSPPRYSACVGLPVQLAKPCIIHARELRRRQHSGSPPPLPSRVFERNPAALVANWCCLGFARRRSPVHHVPASSLRYARIACVAVG